MKEYKPRFTPTFFKATRKLKSDRRKELEKAVLKIFECAYQGEAVKIFFQGVSVGRSGKISNYLRNYR